MSTTDHTREALHRQITKAWLVHIGFQPEDVEQMPDTTEHVRFGCEATGQGYDCMDEDGLSRHPMSDAADQTAEFVGFALDQLSAHVAAVVAGKDTEIERLTALLDRNGAQYCLCSRADVINERWQADCPMHGAGLGQQLREARAALAAERDQCARLAQIADLYAAIARSTTDGGDTNG